MPKLKFCVDSIKAFDQRLRAQDTNSEHVPSSCECSFRKLNNAALHCPAQRCCKQDDAIQRVDEVLLDKAGRWCKGQARLTFKTQAGKYDIVIINSRIEQCIQKAWQAIAFQLLPNTSCDRKPP